MNTEKLIAALLLSQTMPTVRRALLAEARKHIAEVRRSRQQAKARGPVRRVADRTGRYV
jgi:hypothetical protein